MPDGILNQTGFEELYPSLRRFAAAVGDSDCDPDDLVQDALVAYLRRFGGSEANKDDNKDASNKSASNKSASRNGAHNPAAYLRTSVMGLVMDHRRRAARRSVKPTDDPPDEPVQARYPSDLRWLLDEVSPTDRGLLLLVDVDGHSTRDAAALVGVSPIAARSRLSRARHRVRNRLQQGGDCD